MFIRTQQMAGITFDDGSASNAVSDSTPDWLKSITGVAQQVIQVYNAKQIQDVNAARAAQGLPPIDQSAIAPQVNVALSQDTKTMIIVAGLGLLAVLLLRKA
jgi:hypothetical protein